ISFFCLLPSSLLLVFFFNDPATPEIYTLSLHDALPICSFGRNSLLLLLPALAGATRNHASGYRRPRPVLALRSPIAERGACYGRSEEHTSELQSLTNLVCRLLLEKKKKESTGLSILMQV